MGSFFLKPLLTIDSIQERKRLAVEAKNSGDASATKEDNREERVINLRALNMEDLRQAKSQVWKNVSIVYAMGEVLYMMA